MYNFDVFLPVKVTKGSLLIKNGDTHATPHRRNARDIQSLRPILSKAIMMSRDAAISIDMLSAKFTYLFPERDTELIVSP